MEVHVTAKPGERHGDYSEDAYLVRNDPGLTILAAADGHGASTYCRSAQGAQFACRAVTELIQLPEIAPEAFGEALKSRFDEMVRADLRANPLTRDETIRMGFAPPESAYGTTCLAAAVREDSADIYQLGDGEIHLLGADGKFLPQLPDDPDCCLNVTSSLAYPPDEAAAHLRHRHYDTRPAAVFVFTDGYEPMFERPYALTVSLSEPDRIPALLEAGEHGDDQTVLIAWEPQLFAEPAFREGLAALQKAMQAELDALPYGLGNDPVALSRRAGEIRNELYKCQQKMKQKALFGLDLSAERAQLSDLKRQFRQLLLLIDRSEQA